MSEFGHTTVPELVPARMLNEFSYCPRLFHIEWVQQRSTDNQRFAAKNTKLREYLLKGRIRCALCGRVYTGVTRGHLSYYYRRGRANTNSG